MCEGKSIARELLPTQFLRMMPTIGISRTSCSSLNSGYCVTVVHGSQGQRSVQVRACHESVRRPVIALQCPVFGDWLGGS